MTSLGSETISNREKDESDLQLPAHALLPILLMTIALMSLAIVALRATLQPLNPKVFDDPSGWEDIRSALTTVSQGAAPRRILVLGDSALGKNILAEAGDAGAESHRPIAWARKLQDEGVVFCDLSVDGMLPLDMLKVIEELDRHDPGAGVEIVLELSPRYLSRAYATEDAGHARPYFKEENELESLSSPARLIRHRLGLQDLRQSLTSLKHPEETLLGVPSHRPGLEDQLRLARHFLVRSEDSVQLEALRKMVQLFRDKERPALLYSTPINRSRFSGWDLRSLEESEAILKNLVPAGIENNMKKSCVQWQNFDDGLFVARDFLDHVHLTAAANQVLARRILNALRIRCKEPASIPSRLGRNRDIAISDLGLSSGLVEASYIDEDRLLLFLEDNSCQLLTIGERSLQPLPLQTDDLRVSSTPGTILAWRRSEGVASSWQLHSFDDRAGFSDTLILPKEGAWPWAQAKELKIDAKGDFMVLVHDGQITSLNWRTGAVAASTELPEEFANMAPLLGEDRLFLHDASPGLGHEVHVISFSEVMAEHFEAFQLLARTTSNAEEIFDHLAFRETEGLQQPLMHLPELPFVSFDRVWSEAGDLYFRAPAPTTGSQVCLWRLNLATKIIYAVLEPDAEGLVLNSDGQLSTDQVLGFDGHSGWSILATKSNIRLVQTRLLRRMDWVYGAPPSQAIGTVVANGLSYQPRSAEEWRLGVFGSSLVGGSYPDNEPGAGQLRNSFSLARELGRVLDEKEGRDHFRIQSLDFSQAQSDLLRSYITLLSLDPVEIHCAIMSLDAGSLWNPDDPRDRKAAQLPARYDALERDEKGLPEVELSKGFRPRARLAEIGPQHGTDPASSIRNLVHEISWLCESRGIHLIFVDLSTIERQPRVEPLLADLRHAIQEEGMAIIDAKSILQQRGAELPEFAYEGDRHFRPETIKTLAAELPHYLANLIAEDRAEMPALEFKKRESRRRATKLSPALRPVPLLDAWQARVHGVLAENTISENKASLSKLMTDIGQDSEDHPQWKQALAVLGLRSASLVPGQAVEVELIRFENYDEYGRGRGQAPQVVAAFQVAATDLNLALSGLKVALEAERQPTWLKRK